MQPTQPGYCYDDIYRDQMIKPSHGWFHCLCKPIIAFFFFLPELLQFFPPVSEVISIVQSKRVDVGCTFSELDYFSCGKAPQVDRNIMLTEFYVAKRARVMHTAQPTLKWSISTEITLQVIEKLCSSAINQKRREHISPVLAALHWLPATIRIDVLLIYSTKPLMAQD